MKLDQPLGLLPLLRPCLLCERVFWNQHLSLYVRFGHLLHCKERTWLDHLVIMGLGGVRKPPGVGSRMGGCCRKRAQVREGKATGAAAKKGSPKTASGASGASAPVTASSDSDPVAGQVAGGEAKPLRPLKDRPRLLPRPSPAAADAAPSLLPSAIQAASVKHDPVLASLKLPSVQLSEPAAAPVSP